MGNCRRPAVLGAGDTDRACVPPVKCARQRRVPLRCSGSGCLLLHRRRIVLQPVPCAIRALLRRCHRARIVRGASPRRPDRGRCGGSPLDKIKGCDLFTKARESTQADAGKMPACPDGYELRGTGMSAFGRKNGVGGMAPGARPSFGVAKPMKGGPAPIAPRGGEQFPPIPGEAPAMEPTAPSGAPNRGDAMTRLADRANAVNDHKSEVGGFEASVHKIKEQVLPRLLERVDPEAAATLSKEELSEEFRPIIMEVLT